MIGQSTESINLGQLIKRVRSQKGVYRSGLSVSSGIDEDDIARIEHGDMRKGDKFLIIRITKKLDIEPDDVEKIERLVKRIYHRRRVKFHLSQSILSRRRGFIRRS